MKETKLNKSLEYRRLHFFIMTPDTPQTRSNPILKFMKATINEIPYLNPQDKGCKYSIPTR